MSSRAVVLPLLLSGVLVLAEQTFQWGFTNSVSNSLPLCGSLPISITPLPNAPANATGVPPYYLISFAVGSSSAPMTSLIGTNASVVDWTVRHPVGSQLILEVVDSTGASGGIDVPLYGVIAGTTSECLPPPSSQAPFTVSSLTSNGATLNTCDLWTLFFKGGKPPYTVTIAALNTPDVTNMTLGPTDTKLEWPNRADPGSQMIAAVSDSTGRWATGSPLVHTAGSTDVTCTGESSVSGTNATLPDPSLNPGPPPASLSSSSQGIPGTESSSSTSSAFTSSSSSASATHAPPSSDLSSSSSKHLSFGVTLAVTLASALILVLLLLALAHFIMLRRRRLRRNRQHKESVSPYPSPTLTLSIPMPMRSSPSSVNLNLNSPGAELGVTPFLLPDTGSGSHERSRWSKATSLGMATAGTDTTAGNASASPNMRELPPPYAYAHHDNNNDNDNEREDMEGPQSASGYAQSQ